MDNPSQWRTHIFQDGWSHQPATFGWFFWQVLVNIPAPWSIWEWWMDSANVRKLWSWAMGFASLSRFQSAIKVDCEIIQYERILHHPKLGQIWNHQKYYVIIASNNLKKRFAKYIISKQCNNVENRDHVVSFFYRCHGFHVGLLTHTRFFWNAPFFELVSTIVPSDDSMIPKPIHIDEHVHSLGKPRHQRPWQNNADVSGKNLTIQT